MMCIEAHPQDGQLSLRRCDYGSRVRPADVHEWCSKSVVAVE